MTAPRSADQAPQALGAPGTPALPPPNPAAPPEGFDRYLKPEFTRKLLEHMHRAKQKALADAMEAPPDGCS